MTLFFDISYQIFEIIVEISKKNTKTIKIVSLGHIL